MDTLKTKSDVKKRLDGMNLKFIELQNCRREFDKVRTKYEQLLQSAPDAMVFVNKDAKIMLVNAQLADLFGYSEEELPGCDLDRLIPERYRSVHRAHVMRYFENPKVRSMGSGLLIHGLRKDGSEFPADISLSPIETEEGTITVAAIRDLTERKRAEDEKQRLREQLAEAEKLSALGRIAANVADEIRNPLTAVGGFARRLLKIADSDKERQYAEYISSEVGRIENLLNDVLAFSRKRSPLLEDHDIRIILDEALETSADRLGRQSITVRRDYRNEAVVRVDKSHLRDAVERLIANALDAMPSGGKLTALTGQEIVNGVPYIKVSIQDTGEGIPAEKMEKIYEPFFTTRSWRKGTGLGLAIVKNIVEEEGGIIRTASTEGEGTTVTLLFPDLRAA